MITGAQIKRARESVNETQAEFAKRFGVDQSAVSDWERRGPPPRGPGRKAIENELDGLKKAKKPSKSHVSRETLGGGR